MQAGYEAALASDWVDDARLVHVKFDDFVRDPIASVKGIYQRAGMSVSTGYEQRMRDWLADPANSGERHGKFQYSLEQYGLDEDDIRARFAGYYQKFLR